MAHNNYVVGYENKIYRLKETGLYNLDIDGEYSSLTAKYLVVETYDGLLLLLLFNCIDRDYEGGLSKFVSLANLLDRHMVLPIFPCYVKERPETECNLCGHQPINCHKDIMRRAKLSWKEHVFFHNKNVPDIVKQDYLNAPTLFLCLDENCCEQSKQRTDRDSECIILKSNVLTGRSVRKALRHFIDDRVIRINYIPPGLVDNLYID